MTSHKILHLTLKKSWFELMVSGEKTTEFRKPSDWIKQRLVDKEYELVRFVNGYGSDKPFFVAKYLGYKVAKKDEEIPFKKETVVLKKEITKFFLEKLLKKVISKLLIL